MKIAVISDIHGNLWALEAVLEDIETRNPDIIVNLGDSLYGPLKPMETYNLIKSKNITSISGNEDRLILEKSQTTQTLDYVINELSPEVMEWLRLLPKTNILLSDILLCHGTPEFDTIYLTEEAVKCYIAVRGDDDIELLLKGVDQNIILCGHSHIPRLITMRNRTIINPGSVGCPAFNDDQPIFHKIENFSHHSRYCMVELSESGVIVNHISVPYNYKKAVDSALINHRPDWAKWIEFGRV